PSFQRVEKARFASFQRVEKLAARALSVSKNLASRSFPTENGGNVFGKAENSPPARQSRAIRTKVRGAAAPQTTPDKVFRQSGFSAETGFSCAPSARTEKPAGKPCCARQPNPPHRSFDSSFFNILFQKSSPVASFF
ncbi:MAG: hypothetical protein PUD63_03450, partial [Clostridia bacterium]|nr:hypothetical protein [Clostridia bacterium]